MYLVMGTYGMLKIILLFEIYKHHSSTYFRLNVDILEYS